MANLFICYRREDSGGYAGRLYDRLRDHFGAEHVFMDVDSMEPGVDFEQHIEDALGQTAIVFAVIGKRWLTVADDSNQRRLDQPHDYVRLELEAAVKKQIRTIPVLVGDAHIPKPHELPKSLTTLSRLHAVELSDSRWRTDVDRLIHVAEKVMRAKLLHAAKKEQPKDEARSQQHAEERWKAEKTKPDRRQAEWDQQPTQRRDRRLSERLRFVVFAGLLVVVLFGFYLWSSSKQEPQQSSLTLIKDTVSKADDFYFGRDVPRDYSEAAKLYAIAADSGDSYAQTMLGSMYRQGQGGLPQDDSQAVAWYQKGATQGNAAAQYNLGNMYASGRGGLPKDDIQAVAWYEKAATKGNAAAQNSLGIMYVNGRGGLSKDDIQAVAWYEKAAAQENSFAQYNLGAMYEKGRGGLPKDDAKAAAWYRKAAAQGHIKAADRLRSAELDSK